MCHSFTPPEKILNNSITNKLLEANNKKALEMLQRIQSQIEASRVISTSSVSRGHYE